MSPSKILRAVIKSPNWAAVSGLIIAFMGAGTAFAGQWLGQRWMLWLANILVLAGIAIFCVGFVWSFITMPRRLIEDWKRYPSAAVIVFGCGIAGFVILAKHKFGEARERTRSPS